MNLWGRFIIIFIAYGFALLHTAVPHDHAQNVAGRTTIQTHCLISESMGGLLQMVFSTDLGYGHLETFQKSGDADSEFAGTGAFILILLLPLVFSPAASAVLRREYVCFVEKLHIRLLLLSSANFRAPPVLA